MAILIRKTKIVCTLGPSTDDPEVLKQLILSGMDVARFNFSHQNQTIHRERMNQLKKLRDELKRPIATLLDTKGPEVRLGSFVGNKVEIKSGQSYILTTKQCEGDDKKSFISFPGLVNDVSIGTKILVDDGLIELVVAEIKGTEIICDVINGGFLSNNKGVNIPGVKLSMPYLSEQDISDIKFGIEMGFDFIAASFVRSADDLILIRQVLDEQQCHHIRIVAKIENAEGVDNIDDILRVADGIMIARGDLGVEIPFERIPVIQKKLIERAYNAGKQVITATQMLDSMMKNPRPTRAEANDVASAIYDGTSAIMLSGETAAGDYPIETIKAMASIARTTEHDIDYLRRFKLRDIDELPNVTNAISHATVTTAHDLNARAIITVTKTGQTARLISKYRPLYPIISCTTEPTILRQMNMSWGVTPLLIDEKESTDELFDAAVQAAEANKLVDNGDLVVITAGVPLGVSGTTNMMKVHVIGDVLVSGKGITNTTGCGNLCVCDNEEEAIERFKDGDILVVPQTSNNLLSIMRKSSGIVTEQDGMNSHAAIVGLALDIPVIVGAKDATKILKCGATVTIDAIQGIVSSNQNCLIK
ncbi:MAG: pyruvate kinase [Clostridiales bacterium]|nr:pyruvate kinase [Clostridiales bacterium]